MNTETRGETRGHTSPVVVPCCHGLFVQGQDVVTTEDFLDIAQEFSRISQRTSIILPNYFRGFAQGIL
jgi:hypothetical protein